MTDSICKVAIILVHYDNYALEHFRGCYDSLMSQKLTIDPKDVFIIANGASNEARELVSSIAPNARHINLENNLGWSVGNNAGIRQALSEGYDHIVLLNMDVVLDEFWLLGLSDAAKEFPHVQIFQSKILLFGTNKINSIGNCIHYLGYGYCEGYGHPDREIAASKNIPFASGASMLIRREVFELVGLLEEEYFIYYDDLEFCWRARLANYEIALAADSVCYHKHLYKDKLVFLFYLEYNRILTALTLMRWRTMFILFIPFTISQVFTGIYFILKGRLLSVFNIYFHLAKPSTWQFVIKKRKLVRMLRRRNDSEIIRGFSSRIYFTESNHPLVERFANPVLGFYWRLVRRFIIW